MWMMVAERKEATARLLREARRMRAHGPLVSFFGSSTGIASGDGELYADACSIQGWGVTPENSVVNGADTSTDGSTE